MASRLSQDVDLIQVPPKIQLPPQIFFVSPIELVCTWEWVVYNSVEKQDRLWGMATWQCSHLKIQSRLVIPRHCLHSHAYNLNWNVGNSAQLSPTPKISVSNCGLLHVDGSGFPQHSRVVGLRMLTLESCRLRKEDEEAAISLKVILNLL